jgi:hypothetical protein
LHFAASHTLTSLSSALSSISANRSAPTACICCSNAWQGGCTRMKAWDPATAPTHMLVKQMCLRSQCGKVEAPESSRSAQLHLEEREAEPHFELQIAETASKLYSLNTIDHPLSHEAYFSAARTPL